jgi:hypothetical protein
MCICRYYKKDWKQSRSQVEDKLKILICTSTERDSFKEIHSVSLKWVQLFHNTAFNIFQASGVPGYNGLPNIKMEDGMAAALGGVKVAHLTSILSDAICNLLQKAIYSTCESGPGS